MNIHWENVPMMFPAKTTSSIEVRRLAAIMFTDNVGYTALIRIDSTKALENANRILGKESI